MQDSNTTCKLWLPTRSLLSLGTRTRATALAVSQEVAKHASLPRTRDVLRWLWSAYAPYRVLHRRNASLCRRKTVVDMRTYTSNAQPAFAWHARKSHCAGCLSGGGKTCDLDERARHAALAVTGLRTMKGYCTGKPPLSFGVKPWCDVRAVTSSAQPDFV